MPFRHDSLDRVPVSVSERLLREIVVMMIMMVVMMVIGTKILIFMAVGLFHGREEYSVCWKFLPLHTDL